VTAGARKCVCGHRERAHRDYRHQCDAFLCACRKFLARNDTDGILAQLETIDTEAT
jgi:hypothetical protein